jgi:serine/threonine protein kinase
VDDLAGGFSPGATSRLRFPGGTEVFIKAVGAALNPQSPVLHRREAVIAAALPLSASWPHLIDTFDDGDWVALAFEAIDGRTPTNPWQPDELDAVVGALAHMHAELTPSPSDEFPSAAVRLRDTFIGWHALASGPTPPSGLDDWSRRNLSRLAELESGWPEACEGGTLLHCDIRSDNVLLRPAGGVVFVDWPHAAVGSPALDLVCWAPSVVLEGGPDPEELLSRHAPSRDADPAAVTAMVAAVAGFLIRHSLLPPPPGLPTLRPFQAAQGEVARAWLQRRTGW